MTRHQRITLRILAAVIALMVLFPPYVRWAPTAKHYATERGYAFIFDLPVSRFSEGSPRPSEVDVETLAAQVLGALIVGGLIFLSIGGGTKPAPAQESATTSPFKRD